MADFASSSSSSAAASARPSSLYSYSLIDYTDDADVFGPHVRSASTPPRRSAYPPSSSSSFVWPETPPNPRNNSEEYWSSPYARNTAYSLLNGYNIPNVNINIKGILPRIWEAILNSPSKLRGGSVSNASSPTLVTPARPRPSPSQTTGRSFSTFNRSTLSVFRGRGSPTSTLSRASTRYHTPATSRASLLEGFTDPDEPLVGDFPVLIDSGPDFPSDSDIEDEACFCFVAKEDTSPLPSDANGYGYDVGRGTGRDDIRCVIGLNIVSLLPPELGVYILSFLIPSHPDDDTGGHRYGLFDLLPCTLVCHTWYDLVQDNEIWYKAYVNWWGIRRKTSRSTSTDWKQLFIRRARLEKRWQRDGRDFAGPTLTHLQSHTDSVYTAEFALEWGLLVSGSRDRTIRIWDMHARTGRESCLALLRNSGGDDSGHTGSVLCLKFEVMPDWAGATPDRQRFFMVSGSSDCTICVWDFTVEGLSPGRRRRVTQSRLLRTLRGHSGGVLDLRLYDSADGRQWIVSCSKDASIRVWSRSTYEEVRVMRGHDGPVNAIGVWSHRVVSASGDGKMILWDIDTGNRLRTFDGHDRGLACIEFKEDLILTGSNDCTIKVWCARTGRCMGSLEGHRALVRALAFEVYPAARGGGDGARRVKGRVVSASYDRCVRVWDLDVDVDAASGNPRASPGSRAENAPAPGALVREFKQCHTSHIFDVRFDASRIVTTSHDQKIAILDFSRGLQDVCLL